MDKLPLDLRLLLFVPHRWILLPCSGGKGLYRPEAVGVALWLCRGVISAEAGGGCSYLGGTTFSGFDQLFPWYRQFRFHLLVKKVYGPRQQIRYVFGILPVRYDRACPLMLYWHQPSMSYQWPITMDALIHHPRSVLAQMLTLISGSVSAITWPICIPIKMYNSLFLLLSHDTPPVELLEPKQSWASSYLRLIMRQNIFDSGIFLLMTSQTRPHVWPCWSSSYCISYTDPDLQGIYMYIHNRSKSIGERRATV